MKPALVLVDLQNDFLGAAGLEPPASAVVRGAARLAEAARRAGVPVLHVRTSVRPDGVGRMPHWTRRDDRRCIEGTPGQEPPAALAAAPGEAIVAKAFFSAFSSEAMGPALAARGADAVVLAGVHLHGCVRQTALDAYGRGFEVIVAEDAVGSDDPLHAAVTRRYLEGRAARFLLVEEIARIFEGSSGAAAGMRAPDVLPAAIVAGRRVAAEGLTHRVHRSPRETATALFRIPLAGRGEAAAAAETASEAAPAWRTADPRERARPLGDFADRLEREAAGLAALIAGDVGKPVRLAALEVARTAALLRRAASLDRKTAVRFGPDAFARRVPLGVVAIVTPWNNPLAIPWGKIGAALALGNTVVWKPAPAASRVAIRSLELAREAGLPEGVVALVCGDHRAAEAVMADPRVAGISISGSSAAGWSAQEIAARRRVPLQAELGGNNAAVVWDGADVARAAELVARGAFEFAGQRCTANRRAVVRDSLLVPFVDAVREATAALRWGDPLEAATDVGPMLSVAARDAVREALAAAASSAEHVAVPHAGAARALELEALGAYLAPAVVVAPPAAAPIVQEETFGPVLVVQRAARFEEALDLANGVRQGLAAALFSGAGPWRDRFLERAEAGILKGGDSTADADAEAPFGGWKASGVGPPERGSGDLEFYTRAQALHGDL
jgi:acyl-CoA reductase-like NAD-dependent aldehyde dehydrogenase/nicotinamidase-related amidase